MNEEVPNRAGRFKVVNEKVHIQSELPEVKRVELCGVNQSEDNIRKRSVLANSFVIFTCTALALSQNDIVGNYGSFTVSEDA